ncbi:MAG: 1,6-anhydro-N-acetylmuramyl-L-alanine amidase AmpD [Succinivibrionaceae bacterium]
MKILSGWVQGIKYYKSLNYNKRPKNEISLLVIHNISLPPRKFGHSYVEQFFTNNLDVSKDDYFEGIAQLQVSSHFYIKRTGELVQFVSCLDRAWHAGKSVYLDRDNCNDFSIGIELEGSDDVFYTDEQYSKLIELSKILIKSYPDLNPNRIVGHCDIAPTRKTDPGKSFDWNKYLSALSE